MTRWRGRFKSLRLRVRGSRFSCWHPFAKERLVPVPDGKSRDGREKRGGREKTTFAGDIARDASGHACGNLWGPLEGSRRELMPKVTTRRRRLTSFGFEILER